MVNGEFLEPAPVGVVGQRVRVVGIEFHGPFERRAHLGQALGPVEGPQGILHLGKVGIECQSPENRRLGGLDVAQVQQGIGQAAVRQRRLRVCFGRLAVQADAFLQHFDVHLLAVPDLLQLVARQQHQFIGRVVQRCRLGRDRPGIGDHLLHQHHDDRVLHIDQFPGAALEVPGPQYQSALAFDQLHRDTQLVAGAAQAALDQVGDPQTLGDGQRIQVLRPGRDG